MQHPPLKRHVSLQPFSRDHYTGLVQAQHLIKSAMGSAAQRQRAVTEFLGAWDAEIQEHFRDEELLLIPLMVETEMQRLRDEHAQLRRLASEAQHRAHMSDPGPDWVTHLGELLDDHIRWEERELFPALEKRCTSEQLTQIAEATARIESTRPRAGG